MGQKRRNHDKSSADVRNEFLSLKTRIHEFVQKELDQFYQIILPLLSEVRFTRHHKYSHEIFLWYRNQNHRKN